jgi:hypothetical protein
MNENGISYIYKFTGVAGKAMYKNTLPGKHVIEYHLA